MEAKNRNLIEAIYLFIILININIVNGKIINIFSLKIFKCEKKIN